MRLWLRWSWRDMRAHWAQVAAIALVIALGTGTFAGLGSTARWRKASADASFALLQFRDLEVELSEGSFVPEGALVGALEEVAPGLVAGAEERLKVPTQVDAGTATQTILVPGVVIGLPLKGGGPQIDVLEVVSGRPLGAADSGAEVVLLERNFAEYYGLPPAGSLSVAGDRRLDYAGTAASPDYFIVMPEDGSGFMLQANFAVLFSSLETAQALAGAPGQVNRLVVRLAAGVEPETAEREVAAALAERLPGVGATLIPRDEQRAYAMIYQDIENDQQTFSIFAMLIFVGAVAAAFNLTTRLVEAQRREIGIAMALGVSRRRIAVRPLLVGAQIALLGVALGVGVGWVIAVAMQQVLEGFFPLPVWLTSFQPGAFVGAAAAGFAAPFAAVAYPVWRAVRVRPIEAIRSGHLARRVRIRWWRPTRRPANTFGRLPLRNLARAPRRTVLTALGIASAIAVLTTLLGMIDSFFHTVDVGEREILAGNADRVIVDLDHPYQAEDPEVVALLASPALAGAQASLAVPGRLGTAAGGFEVLIGLTDFARSPWVPQLTAGSSAAGDGVIIARKAAGDLGVGVGDAVTLVHPRRRAEGTYEFVLATIRVAGIHAAPYRFLAYMDASQSDRMGLNGMVNQVNAAPATGHTVDDVKRDLFRLESVASVQPATVVADTFRDLLGRFIGLLRVVQGAVFVLALAIAFNAASLNLDERARDLATMFAFGVTRRRALRLAMAEGALLGLLATGIGLAAGYGLLGWFVSSVFPRTAPDIGLVLRLTPQTLAVITAMGVAAVALAPLLTLRKMGRMDVPGTLRVME
ncbi:MAG: FtsX-like permease family protein [Actinobacteria bacterium]|nr:FtsX-like permease family protein [Actinomycetota bacterium]